jgi:hypothetical protein
MRAALAASVAALLLASVAAGAAAPPAPPAAPPLLAFPGQDSRQAGVNPADVQLAVGPTAVVQAVNSSIAIWSPAGVLQRQQTLGQFFSGGGIDRSPDATTDPRILWDPVSGRFFAVMFDISRLEIVLAMSITSDPLGPWAVFSLPSSGCTDQPRLGTSDKVVVVTDDLFSSCSGFGRFVGGEILVLNKQDMLNGVASPQRARFGPDRRFASVTPSVSLVSTPVMYLVATSDTGKALQVITVPDVSVTALPFKDVAVSELVQPEEAPQRATSELVDAGDNRIQNAVFDAGRLWATATVGCGTGRDCARVFELDPAAPRLVRDTQVALPGSRALLYPALVPDSRGNVVVGFSFSSPGDFPGFGYAYVRPDGGVSAPIDVQPGSAPQTSGRFGDYSGAARDPSDPSRIWISAQLGQAPTQSSLEWGSGIAAVRVPPQAPAIVSTAAKAGTVTAGLYAEGLPTSYRVQFGPTKAYGSQTAPASVPATAREQPVARTLLGLVGGATYHARVVATNAVGTTASTDVVFKTAPGPPQVAYPLRPSSSAGLVTLRARVGNGGAPTRVYFEYGATRRYGSRTRAVGPVRGDVAARIRTTPGTVLHFRAVATNAKGTRVAPDRTVRAG